MDREPPDGGARFVISREGVRADVPVPDGTKTTLRPDGGVMTTLSETTYRWGTTRSGRRCQCRDRLPGGLYQVRQGRGHLLLHRDALGCLRQVGNVRLRDAHGADHLPGFAVPVDRRRQPALLLVLEHRFVVFEQQQHELFEHVELIEQQLQLFEQQRRSGGITGATCTSTGIDVDQRHGARHQRHV